MQDPALYTSDLFPTKQDVIDLIYGRGARGLIIVPQARLLDKDLVPYPLAVPLDVNDPTALCTVDGGWIRDIQADMNTQDDIHRKCTFRLYEFPGIRSFNTLTNRVQFSTQYYHEIDGKPVLIADIPYAIFMFTIPDRTLLDSGNFWDITGHGLTQALADLGFENKFTLPKNANVVDSVVAMLMMDEFPPDQGGRLPSTAPVAPGGCIGCLPGPDTGTSFGYCQQGWPVYDPKAGTGPYGSSTTIRQRAATGFGSTVVLYNTTIGMKLDAPSGAPIDPYSCTRMTVQTIIPGDVFSMVPGELVPGEAEPGEVGEVGETPFPAFILSVLDAAGNEMYIDTPTGLCYDVITGDQVDPDTGLPATLVTPTLFTSRGGDGGLGVANGNNAGYCPSFGWAIDDTAHALTVRLAPGSVYYTHFLPGIAGRLATYLSGVGAKIDASTGAIIDPWNCQLMPLVGGGTGGKVGTGGSRFTGMNYYYPSPGWTGWHDVSWLHDTDYTTVGSGSGFADVTPQHLLESDFSWMATNHVCDTVRIWISIDSLLNIDIASGYTGLNGTAVTNLIDAIHRAAAHNLRVILVGFDFAPTQVFTFHAEALDGSHATMRANYLTALGAVITVLAADGTVVSTVDAFDLFNEAYYQLRYNTSQAYSDAPGGTINTWVADLVTTAKAASTSFRYAVSDVGPLLDVNSANQSAWIARYPGVDVFDIHLYDDNPSASTARWATALNLPKPYYAGECGVGIGHQLAYGYNGNDSRTLAVDTWWIQNLPAYGFFAACIESQNTIFSLPSGAGSQTITDVGSMLVAATSSGTGLAPPHTSSIQDLWQTSQTFGGLPLLYDSQHGLFYTWDGTTLVNVFPQWMGVTPTAPATVFTLAGGDGGVSTLPAGAVGPQTGSVGGYIWPDSNNPGLTPAGCPTSGPNIPRRRIIATPSDQVFPDTMSFDPKINFFTACNQALDSINYWKIWDDPFGNYHLDPMPEINGIVPVADQNFPYTTGPDGVIAPGIIQKINDATAVYNKIVVRSENTKRAAITAVAYNRSERSFLAVQNLGRIKQLVPAIQLDAITDQAVLEERALIELEFAALGAESVELTVLLQPFLVVHDVIGINVWSPDGTILEITSEVNPFLITAHEMDFVARTSKITAGRLIPL